MPQSIGYARCSTTHQDTNAQVTELRSAGCQEVFAEKVSSRAPLEKRPQLRRCLETLEVGDELVVSKLDRLGRSQVEVINRLSDLQTKGDLRQDARWTDQHQGVGETCATGDWTAHGSCRGGTLTDPGTHQGIGGTSSPHGWKSWWSP